MVEPCLFCSKGMHGWRDLTRCALPTTDDRIPSPYHYQTFTVRCLSSLSEKLLLFSFNVGHLTQFNLDSSSMPSNVLLPLCIAQTQLPYSYPLSHCKIVVVQKHSQVTTPSPLLLHHLTSYLSALPSSSSQNRQFQIYYNNIFSKRLFLSNPLVFFQS